MSSSLSSTLAPPSSHHQLYTLHCILRYRLLSLPLSSSYHVTGHNGLTIHGRSLHLHYITPSLTYTYKPHLPPNGAAYQTLRRPYYNTADGASTSTTNIIISQQTTTVTRKPYLCPAYLPSLTHIQNSTAALPRLRRTESQPTLLYSFFNFRLQISCPSQRDQLLLLLYILFLFGLCAVLIFWQSFLFLQKVVLLLFHFFQLVRQSQISTPASSTRTRS